MRRLLLVVALAGCASPPSTGTATLIQPTVLVGGGTVEGSGVQSLYGDQPRASAANLPAAPAAVWLAVKKVYVALGIPLTVENMAAHQLGNANFYKSHQMAGVPMTELVSCGNDQTGPRASSYRIYMSLLTTVTADDKGGTRLETTFVPMAENIAEGASDRIPCGTTGRLEQIVIENVKKQVGGS